MIFSEALKISVAEEALSKWQRELPTTGWKDTSVSVSTDLVGRREREGGERERERERELDIQRHTINNTLSKSMNKHKVANTNNTFQSHYVRTSIIIIMYSSFAKQLTAN